MQATKHANEGIHPALRTLGRCHQKSKTGVLVAPKKGMMSSKIFLKKCSHFLCPIAVTFKMLMMSVGPILVIAG